LIAERGIKTDRTWTRKLRFRALEIFVGFAAILVSFALIVNLDPNLPFWAVIPFVIAGFIFLLGGLLSISFVEFWSEVVCVVDCIESGSGNGAPERSGTSIRVSGGYVRSENWAVKGAVGRTSKLMVAQSTLDSTIRDVLVQARERRDSVPLP